nr:retrovirus-related Pol polyprotein from transposon TNT 1-94 [Tanacetum cinerariifolium]
MHSFWVSRGCEGVQTIWLDNESPKIVTSRNVVFNESVMYKDTLKDSGAGADKSVEELQVEVELQRLNNHTLEEDQTDNEDQTDQDNGDDEDAGVQEIDQPPDLTDYQLVRDREPRIRTKPLRFRDESAGDQEIDQPPDLTDYQLVRDREPRTRTKPLRFRDESNMATYAFAEVEEEDTHEPLTYQEAVACEDSSKWKAAMKEEMDSLRKNKTWELVDHQAGQNLVTCKWLFKIKEGIEGVQKPRNKARLVAHGFTQRAGIDYNEVFLQVVRHTSIRVILALTACKDFELEQLDVKTAFLHGNLEEVIYMRQPPGYEQGNKVCLLKKSLYGLKQSPRQWYRRFDEYILSNGFKRSSYDICIYYKSYAPGEYIYLLLYVDDMPIACKSKAEIGSTKSLLKREFDMKDLGEAKKILGMEIIRDRSRKILRVSQSGYISKILNNFIIDNGKSVQMPLGGHFKLSLKDCPIRDCDVKRMSKVPYANAVGSLMYLMVCTRPDIAYAISIVSRYLANPGKNHWEAVKWILKYLRGTANVGLIYGTNRGNHKDVTGFVDSDYAKDPDKGRGGVYGPYGGCEGSYLAKGLLEELGVELNRVTVNCDNHGAIHLSRNHVFHERTKHINVRYHFIREVLEAKTVEVLKVGTEHNAADALTKVVPGHKLQHCLELLSVEVGLFGSNTRLQQRYQQHDCNGNINITAAIEMEKMQDQLNLVGHKYTDGKNSRGIKRKVTKLCSLFRKDYLPEISLGRHLVFYRPWSLEFNHIRDGRVELKEFFEFMRAKGRCEMTNFSFFKQLDKDGNGTLDFWEVMTLYYIVNSGRPFCDHCKKFITSTYLTCVGCMEDPIEGSFYLCLDSYMGQICDHTHSGLSRFLDNYLLLGALDKSILNEIPRNKI